MYSTHDIHMLRNTNIFGHICPRPQFVLFCLLLDCAATHSAPDVQVSAELRQSWFTFGLQKLRDVRSIYCTVIKLQTMQYNNMEQSVNLASLIHRHSSVIWMLNITGVQQVSSSQHISCTRDSITKLMCGHSTIHDTCSHQQIPVCTCVSLSDTNLFLLHTQISVAAVSQFYLVWIYDMETSHTSVQYSRYLLSLQCLQNAWPFKHLLYAGFGLTNDMLQPCHDVHPQEEIKLPLQQPSLAKLLQVSLTSEAPLILVSSRELIHPHISSGLDSTSSGGWSNASDASSLSRNAPCTVSM